MNARLFLAVLVIAVCAPLAAPALAVPAASEVTPPPAAVLVDLPADSLAADSTLSIVALERWVLARNPDLEAERWALTAAAERPRMAGALMDPELEFAVGPASFDEADLPTAYRIGIKQMLPWAKLGPRRDAARYEAAADSAGLAAMRNDLLRMTGGAYVDYVRGAAALRVIRELQELVEQLRRAALSRYAAGLVGESDPLMAEVEQSRLEREAIDGERQRDVARAQLNALLHRAWDAPLPPPPAGFDAPGAAPPLAELVAAAVRTRPEIAGAEARALASQARLTLAGREWLPDVGVMAAYDRFMMEDAYRPMVGVSVNLPLGFGRNAAAKREARAGVAEATALVAAEQGRVAFEVQVAYLDVLNTAHAAELVRDSELPANRRALGAARAGYESGRNDFLTLVNAARDLARTQLEEISALAEHRLALAELERAVGVMLPGSVREPRGGGEEMR
jgi:cobalt-zinc-cadmium efflux system outer membrane protein